jgi:hypothetical protein
MLQQNLLVKVKNAMLLLNQFLENNWFNKRISTILLFYQFLRNKNKKELAALFLLKKYFIKD